MKKNKLDKVEQLLKERKLQDAKALCRRECTKHKATPAAWNLMGIIQNELGSYPEAEQCFQRVIALQPQSALAYYNLAKCLAVQNKLEKAEKYYLKATQLNPSYIEAYNNLGAIQVDLKKYDEAENNYKKATQLNPSFAFALNNLCIVQTKLFKFEESIKSLERSMELKPEYAKAYQNNYSNILLHMNYSNLLSRQDIYEAHKQWGIAQENDIKQQLIMNNTPDPDKTLRIAFISPDFRDHAVAYFFEPLLENITSDAFEIFCYSDVEKPDDTTEHFKKLSHNWRHCVDLPDEAVTKLIIDDHIDILIDLAGHTGNNRLTLFAKRVAPVQISYLGYPNTTGLSTMDYLITDRFLDPDEESEKYYVEKLLHLPNSFFCYKAPIECPEVASAPVLNNDYITFGSYNNLIKTDEEVIALWSEVLRAVPNSRLIIQTASLKFPPMREKYEKLFLANHISLARIDLVSSSSFSDYLAGHANVDILLDTFPWNGHTVSCHALWMGVPFITLAQDKRSSRMGLSILKTLGLDSCIAFNKDQYVNCARQLAEDRPQLEVLRKTLRERMQSSPLCNSKQFTQDFETQLRSAWRTWCENKIEQA